LNRLKTINAIENIIGNRSLGYFGTRGDDAFPLLCIRQFDSVFSQIAPLKSISVEDLCLETLSGIRVDLDAFDIDKSTMPEIDTIKSKLLAFFDKSSVFFPYSPTAVLASAYFPRHDRVKYCGLFHKAQKCFEHKAWVETELKNIGIKVIPWAYYPDNQLSQIKYAASHEPIVLRTNSTSGGTGVRLITSPDEIEGKWPKHNDGFLSMAPYLDNALPLNINCCVFENDFVSLHGLSIQLIGVKECTNLDFGYCGNDFSPLQLICEKDVCEIETISKRVGQWLFRSGYRGAFGIDFLKWQNQIFLTEINPRFQGSSRTSAQLDKEMGLADVFLCHLSAFLGIPGYQEYSLLDQTKNHLPLSHVVVHNNKNSEINLSQELLISNQIQIDRIDNKLNLLPESDIQIKPGAIVFSLLAKKYVTQDGYSVTAEISKDIQHTLQAVSS